MADELRAAMAAEYDALIGELLESPLDGARYAVAVVKRRRRAALVATSAPPAPGLPLDAETVRALREALLRELPGIDRSIESRWVALAFDRAAMKVGARLAIDAATDEAERVWSQKLPDGVPKG